MTDELTPDEKEVARKLWHSLMMENKLKGEEWQAASKRVQDAVVAAMTAAYDLAMTLRTAPNKACPFR